MASGGIEVGAVSELRKRLTDAHVPVAARMRTVFGLKELGRVGGGSTQKTMEEAMEALSVALRNDVSALVRHEAAYAMGQTQNPFAIPYLSVALRDLGEDPMVRHEAAEALGAISTEECSSILEEFREDSMGVVKETVEIALKRCEMVAEKKQNLSKHYLYQSIDPAPPASNVQSVDILRDLLVNSDVSMYERYEAMFALRNKAATDEKAVLALCDGFVDSSALLKHEIAYVLGQVQSPAAIPALSKVLLDREEHEMVRHEAAEALGSVGTTKCEELLRNFLRDEAQVVRESCEVALDISDYNTSDALHYTDTLVQ